MELVFEVAAEEVIFVDLVGHAMSILFTRIFRVVIILLILTVQILAIDIVKLLLLLYSGSNVVDL